MRGLMICKAKTDLAKMIGTLHASRGFAGRLHRGQQQGHKRADDGDHHQQLDKREGTPKWTPECRLSNHEQLLFTPGRRRIGSPTTHAAKKQRLAIRNDETMSLP